MADEVMQKQQWNTLDGSTSALEIRAAQVLDLVSGRAQTPQPPRTLPHVSPLQLLLTCLAQTQAGSSYRAPDVWMSLMLRTAHSSSLGWGLWRHCREYSSTDDSGVYKIGYKTLADAHQERCWAGICSTQVWLVCHCKLSTKSLNKTYELELCPNFIQIKCSYRYSSDYSNEKTNSYNLMLSYDKSRQVLP